MKLNCREMQNDTIVLENPHKGWYHHYLDQGFHEKWNFNYNDEFADDVTKLPAEGVNHLYIRFDWSDIEIDDGVYDWSPIDKMMARFPDYPFALRMCTYGTFGGFAVPECHVKKGIKGKYIEFGETKCFEPDYSDEIYFQYLERFMAEYARKFGNDPRIEYIDIGTFGTWGEGHTWCGSVDRYPIPVLIKHIDLHLKYFPDKLLVINDDMIRHVGFRDEKMDWFNNRNDEAINELLEYCAERGIGIRDDGICVKVHCDEFPYSYATVCLPHLFERLSKNAPVNLEMAQYYHHTNENLGQGLRMYEAMRETHATYAGYHGYLKEWYRDYPEIHKHLANKLGYWYFIDEMNIPDFKAGVKNILSLKISNRGFSKAYHRYDLKVMLEGEKGSYLLNDESPDNRLWEAESQVNEDIHLNLKDVPCGEYTLKIGMFYRDTPIKIGFDPKFLTEDGYYAVCNVKVTSLSM